MFAQEIKKYINDANAKACGRPRQQYSSQPPAKTSTNVLASTMPLASSSAAGGPSGVASGGERHVEGAAHPDINDLMQR